MRVVSFLLSKKKKIQRRHLQSCVDTSPRAAQPSPSSGLLEARQRRVREERPQLAGCGPAAGRSENRAASRPERLKPAPQALRAKNKKIKNKKSSPISISNLQSPASYFAGSSQISDLHLQSPISNVIFCRIQSDLRSPSPISNLQSRPVGEACQGGDRRPSKGMLFSFHTFKRISTLFSRHFAISESATRFSRRLWREVNISVSSLRSRGADGGSSRSLSSVKDI